MSARRIAPETASGADATEHPSNSRGTASGGTDAQRRPLIYRVLDAVAGDRRLQPVDVCVLVYVTKFADGDGSGCFAANETIADAVGVSQRTIKRSMVKLVDLDMIARRRRKWRSAVTTILVGADSRGAADDTSCDSRSDTGGTSKDQEVPPVTARSATGDRKKCHPCHRTVPLPTQSTDPQGSAPPADDSLAEIPTKDGRSWVLTETIRAEIAAEYPAVDVVAVAGDMARKIRVGARDPYTVRGMKKALASWVAQEAKSGRRTTPSGIRPDPHVGAPPSDRGEWVVDTYRRTDLEAHGDDPLWIEYTEGAADLPPRTAPSFDEWKTAGPQQE